MRTQAAVGAAALTTFAMMQSCPAPVWTVVSIVAPVVVKGIEVIVKSVTKRDIGEEGFEIEARLEVPIHARQGSCFNNVDPGVPPHIIENCCAGLQGAYIKVTGDNPESGIKISGLPYDCIPAAPWFDGTGAVPYACGDDCLQYSGLSGDEYNELKKVFESHA